MAIMREIRILMVACTCGTTAIDASDISATTAPSPHTSPHTSPRFCGMSSEDFVPIDDANGSGYHAGCAAFAADMTGNYREYMVARSAARSPAQYPTFVPWGSVAVEPMDCGAYVSTNITMAEFLQSFKPACCAGDGGDVSISGSPCSPGIETWAPPIDPATTVDTLAAYNGTCVEYEKRRGCNLDVRTFLRFVLGYNIVAPLDEPDVPLPIRISEVFSPSRWPQVSAEFGREIFGVAVFAPIETAWATWASDLDGSLQLGQLERYVDGDNTSTTLLNHIAPLPLFNPQNESFAMLGGAAFELRVRRNRLGQNVAEVFIQGDNGTPIATVLKARTTEEGIIYFVDAVLRAPEGLPAGPDHPVDNGSTDTGPSSFVPDAREPSYYDGAVVRVENRRSSAGPRIPVDTGNGSSFVAGSRERMSPSYVDCNASQPCGPGSTCSVHGVCMCHRTIGHPTMGNGAICVAPPHCVLLNETECSQTSGCQMRSRYASTMLGRAGRQVCEATATITIDRVSSSNLPTCCPATRENPIDPCRSIPSGTPLRADIFSPRTWMFFSVNLTLRPWVRNEFTVGQNLSALPAASTSRNRTGEPLYPLASWVTNVPGMLCPLSVSDFLRGNSSNPVLPMPYRAGAITPRKFVVSRYTRNNRTGLESHWTVPNGYCHVGEQDSSSGHVRTTGSHSWSCHQGIDQYLTLSVYESPDCTGNTTSYSIHRSDGFSAPLFRKGDTFFTCPKFQATNEVHTVAANGEAQPAPLTVLEYEASDRQCMSTTPTTSTQTVSGLCMSSDGVNGFVYTAIDPDVICDGRPVPVTIALYPDDPSCERPQQAGVRGSWPTLIWQDQTIDGCTPMYGDPTNTGSRRMVICGQRAPAPATTMPPAGPRNTIWTGQGPRTTSATAGTASPSIAVGTTTHSTTATATATTTTTTTTANENRNANRLHSSDGDTMYVGEVVGVGALCVIALIVIVGVIVRENRIQPGHSFPYSSFNELSTIDEYSSSDSSDIKSNPPPSGLSVPAMHDANGNSLPHGDVDALATVAKRARLDITGPVGNDGMMHVTPFDDPRRAGMSGGQIIDGMLGTAYIGNAGLGSVTHHNGVHLGGLPFNVGPNTMAETQFSCAPAHQPLPMLPAGIDLMSIPGIGMLNQATMNSILNHSSPQMGLYNLPSFISGASMNHDVTAAACISGSTPPVGQPHNVFYPAETSGALASSRYDETLAHHAHHLQVDTRIDTKPSIAEIERSLVLASKSKKKKKKMMTPKQKRTISFEKFEPERLKVIAKPKRFESLTDPEWHHGLKTATKSAFARLQPIEGRRPSDAVLARILAGETAKQRQTKRPCFRVQRQNLASKSPFQVQIGDARMVAQKIIFATYRHIKPSEMGTWQVTQDCLHNDDTWWCFEPTHLKKCEKDHIPAGVPRNKIPFPPDAHFVAKSRRSRSSGAAAVATKAGTASCATENDSATTGSWMLRSTTQVESVAEGLLDLGTRVAIGS